MAEEPSAALPRGLTVDRGHPGSAGVPAEPDDPEAPANRAAWDVLRQWDRPFLVAFSDRDPDRR